MNLPPRKYFSELTLGLHTRNALALSPDQLLSGLPAPEDAKAVIDLCHIYAICKRPRLSFVPEKFEYKQATSTGVLVRRVGGVMEEHPFSFPMINEAGGKVAVGPYPHREILGYDRNAEPVVHWPATSISLHGDLQDRSINDFEVLYMGQAFGDGTRTAFERLQNHQTLQKILADVHAKHPDDEVMLFLFEYEPATVHIQMDGIGKDAEIKGDEDLEHLRSVLNDPPTEKEQISIAEAGLIWYFNPEYNIKLKGGKPNDELKLLKSCYNLDIAGLIVEINTEEFPCRLWSPSRQPGHHHIAQFDLHDPKTRRTYFSLVDGKGQMTLMDLSGPTY
jgi:hypothetical protein